MAFRKERISCRHTAARPRQSRKTVKGIDEMSETDDEEETIETEMRQALAAYDGPVTRCSPGEARAKPAKAADKAGRWLWQHRDDRPARDPKEERRRNRMARARRQRIAEGNAALLKGMRPSK
jgi:hypothetical protein